MKLGKFSIPLIIISMAAIALSACSPTRISVEEYNRIHGITSTSVPASVEDEDVVPETGEEQEPAPVEESTQVADRSTEDIPIMESGYQVQVTNFGKSITYQVDGTIDDVVAYYQEVLPDFAWDLAGPPDNAVGSIATMLRENAAGERLAINMQFNEVGGFVILTISIQQGN